MKPLSLNMPIQDLFMVGKTYASRLKKLKIKTVEDLLHHYPFRYEDFRLISKISRVQPGEKVTLQGEVIACQNIYTKTGKKIQKAVVRDSSGQIEAVWFNQPFIPQALKPGLKVSLSGKVNFFGRKLSLVSPEYELVKGSSVHTGRLVPIYPETYGLSSKWLRSRIAPVLNQLKDKIPDWLPESLKKSEGLLDLKNALRKIHFPENEEDIQIARKRLKFDELFFIQLQTLIRKKNWQKNKISHPFLINQDKILKFIQSLPFALTAAQNRAVKEILNDLKKKKPMNRLLEGDVGSGKTVVAAIALYAAFLNKLQAAFMAPTEILAQQHYQTIKALLEPLGVKIALLTGNQKLKIENCEWKIVIGTHALIYDKVKIDNLGLVVIDEQHRFGVEQRAKLIKKGKAPHLLTMTATPIPRTIALTLYGDLDLSVLEEMPRGRKKIKTWVVPWQKREAAYDWVKKQIKKNQSQAFLVCPLIEASDKESMKDIRAAAAEFSRLTNQVFPQFKLALLHGRLKTKEKEKIVNQFKNKKLHLLVATPVVEVGLDMPQATIMIIEGAERFGLAQLHQLRGRVGRSDKQSYCLLFASQKDKESRQRLQAMQKYHSGFKLAEIDLKLRGPGEIYGTSQHGFINLKIASFADADLIEKTKKAGEKIIPHLNQFPLLKGKIKKDRIKQVEPN
jgi:ATP-dependent DNA helicase RecG